MDMLLIPKQHLNWAPVGPQLGLAGPQVVPTGAQLGMLLGLCHLKA